MRIRDVTAAAVLCLLFTACTEDGPVDLQDPPPPSGAIVDGLNGIGGNPYAFLKPPVVDDPDPVNFAVFDPNVDAIVEICRTEHLDAEKLCPEADLLTTNDGTATPARYTLTGGPGGEAITVDVLAEEYQVNIHFALFTLEDNTTYTIVMRTETGLLAYADLEVVSPREMRNAGTENTIYFTNDQKTLPWKARLDHGAECWAADDCEVATVVAGQQTTVEFFSSDDEEVDFHLPSGWSATVDGQSVTELTISIREKAVVDPNAPDPSCFGSFVVGDANTGEPENCYDVQADTRSAIDVTVFFGDPAPILSFCPDQEALQAIADGDEAYVITSVEEDAANATRRTYGNVFAPTDFGGCVLPPPTISFGESSVGRFAAGAWKRLRPVLKPVLPTPLYAVDIGFGGEVLRLGTIFFWARTPVDLQVNAALASIAVGGTFDLDAVGGSHEPEITLALTDEPTWTSSNLAVATVDAFGVVTGVGTGTAEITATVSGILDPDGNPLSASSTVTVTVNDGVIFSASFENETIGAGPSTPEIGTWATTVDDGAGSITVQNGLGDMTSNVVVLERTGPLGLILAGNVAGTPPSSGTWVATWKYVVATDPSASIFGPVVFRGNGGIIGSVEFRSNNQITLNSNDPNQGDLVGSWTQNVSQTFEFLIDLDNKTTSLKIDGVTVATGRAFPQPATTLDRIAVEVGFTTAQKFGWDDIEIAPVEAAPVSVDGVLSAGEWDGATTVAFDANVPDGNGGTTTTPATLFIQNDATNLYLAVRFARSAVDAGTNLLHFEFDHDNDGTGPEVGDDYITFNLAVGQLSDAHRSSSGGVTTDGIRHGEGAFTNDGTQSVYEIWHPLNSGEVGQDLALTPPATVGMYMLLSVGSVDTRPFGPVGNYQPITIN